MSLMNKAVEEIDVLIAKNEETRRHYTMEGRRMEASVAYIVWKTLLECKGIILKHDSTSCQIPPE